MQERLAGVIATPASELVPGPAVQFIGRRHGRRADRRWARSWSRSRSHSLAAILHELVAHANA